jgi:hypothetical protein
MCLIKSAFVCKKEFYVIKMHGTTIKIMSVVEQLIANVLFIYYLMGLLITYAEVKVSDNLKVIVLICKYF